MKEANTSYSYCAAILFAITIVSLLHSLTFFHTVKFFPGGATSAGVMKALQAVLVFIATSITFCGRLGGKEMCFTLSKFVSLIVVVIGLLIYGKSTEIATKREGYSHVESETDLAEYEGPSLQVECQTIE